LYGSSAPQADGRDSFQGVASSAARKFPTVTAGQPVPPPFVTAVARIVRDSDGATMCEARKRVCIPQVVKMVYDADAVATVKAGFIGDNGITVVSPMTDAEWNVQKGRIKTIAQNLLDMTGANVRFVDDGDSPVMPYSTLHMKNDNRFPFGETDGDSMNSDPSGEAFLHARALRKALENRIVNTAMPLPSFPVTQEEVGTLWGKVAAHESAHMLGLVEPGNVLNGSTEWHNPGTAGVQIMDKGENNTLEQRFQREGASDPWTWCPLNAEFLRFVLPKQ
jgi:hypothetical protein